jgi:hypothetical protein
MVWRVGEKVHWRFGAVGLHGTVENLECIPNAGPYSAILRIASEDGTFYAYPYQLGHGEAPPELRKWRMDRLDAR